MWNKGLWAIAFEFYIHGYVHRNFILIRSTRCNSMQVFIYCKNYCTCFGYPSHPSSGVHKTVTAPSGTGHSNNIATTFLQRGQRPRWRKIVPLLLLWPVPEAAVTVLCTPDNGCDGHPKHVRVRYGACRLHGRKKYAHQFDSKILMKEGSSRRWLRRDEIYFRKGRYEDVNWDILARVTFQWQILFNRRRNSGL